MVYASSTDLQLLLRVSEFTVEEEQQAELMLELASGKIDTRLCQSLLLVSDDAVTVDGTGTRRLVLPAWPVSAVTSVVVDGETLVFDEDYLWSEAGILTRVGGCWPCEPRSVEVTFTHGYAQVPPGVRGAAARIAGVWWENPTNLQSETFVDYSYRVASTADTRVDDILDELEGAFAR